MKVQENENVIQNMMLLEMIPFMIGSSPLGISFSPLFPCFLLYFYISGVKMPILPPNDDVAPLSLIFGSKSFFCWVSCHLISKEWVPFLFKMVWPRQTVLRQFLLQQNAQRSVIPTAKLQTSSPEHTHTLSKTEVISHSPMTSCIKLEIINNTQIKLKRRVNLLKTIESLTTITLFKSYQTKRTKGFANIIIDIGYHGTNAEVLE